MILETYSRFPHRLEYVCNRCDGECGGADKSIPIKAARRRAKDAFLLILLLVTVSMFRCSSSFHLWSFSRRWFVLLVVILLTCCWSLLPMWCLLFAGFCYSCGGFGSPFSSLLFFVSPLYLLAVTLGCLLLLAETLGFFSAVFHLVCLIAPFDFPTSSYCDGPAVIFTLFLVFLCPYCSIFISFSRVWCSSQQCGLCDFFVVLFPPRSAPCIFLSTQCAMFVCSAFYKWWFRCSFEFVVVGLIARCSCRLTSFTSEADMRWVFSCCLRCFRS